MLAEITCSSCRGKGEVFALVDGPKYSGPATFKCRTCSGTGTIDAQQQRWQEIGGTHRTWRIAQWETLRDCAARLGTTPAELSSMEQGRKDPEPLVADIPVELWQASFFSPDAPEKP